MKIFYTASLNGIDQDLDQLCPFNKKSKGGNSIYLGSVACRECEHCYGYGQHPNPMHNLVVIPFYSRNTEALKYRADSELPEYTLKDCKFISEDDYVKCMKCYSDYGQKMRKNRFKLWYWKHIGEKLSDARYWVIDSCHRLKWKLQEKVYRLKHK